MNYLKMLVEEFHSAIVATIGEDGHPQTRAIDMMLWDENGVYFLTAKGKAFYAQLVKQQYIALSATRDKMAISLRGSVKNIGDKRLDDIFKRNAYMQSIYPDGTRAALAVFLLYRAQGEYFDISNPANVVRDSFAIGDEKTLQSRYIIGNSCTSCGACYSVCPQKCINLSRTPAEIIQRHCLNCGQCAEVCPVHAVKKR